MLTASFVAMRPSDERRRISFLCWSSSASGSFGIRVVVPIVDCLCVSIPLVR